MPCDTCDLVFDRWKVSNQLHESDSSPAFHPLSRTEFSDPLMALQKFADPGPKPARTNAVNDLNLFESMKEGLVDEPVDQRNSIFNRQTNDVD